jgi:hypothetical protein
VVDILKRTLELLVLAALIIPPAASSTSTNVPQQDIIENTHWTVSGSPYIIYGDVLIRNGATLTIDAGVEVRFAKVTGDGGHEDGAELVIQSGTLLANGSKGFPVVFTAHASNPQPGHWGGIIAEYDNQFVLDHTNIRYATHGLQFFNFTLYGSSNSSTDYLEISNCSESGIYVNNSYADIYHTTLRDNVNGISTKYFCDVNVHLSDIFDNGLYNFKNEGHNNVNATECWWGTTVEGLIELRIYDEKDNPAVGEVDYKPYLSGSFKDMGSMPQYSWGAIKSLFSSDRSDDGI